MALSELNKISIAIIIYYSPALLVAIYLCLLHGWGRSSGWLYLALFSLVRLLGASLELATIANPTNVSLLIGTNTLQSIGFSPLMLISFGLLSRVVESIRRTRSTIVTPYRLRFVQTLVMVGLVLGIVGGVNLGSAISNQIAAAAQSGQAVPTTAAAIVAPTETKVGQGFMIAGFCLLVIMTAITAVDINAAEPGEKRLLLAVGLALPFVLVRLIFGASSTFGTSGNFKAFGGSAEYPDYFLGMAVIMEMCAILIFESIGLMVQTRPGSCKGKGGRSGEGIHLGAYDADSA